ncbi:GntR family transcriptional regulator [Streptomyces sp. WSLK1-3]|uniref:GntR family transcriptional regulator n=1 Tax=Streptomyces sp. WSLK1-3 TaxID=3375475 RepID=UPI0037A3F142
MPEASLRGTYLIIAETPRSEVRAEGGRDALPSEADLMNSHSGSRNTIRRALTVLEAVGVVESAPCIGGRVVRGSGPRSLPARVTDVIKEDSPSVPAYPSEAKLCARFGASRTAVRRVLVQLEGHGLLDTVHGKERTVRALPASAARP